jgi:hypothetical protein
MEEPSVTEKETMENSHAKNQEEEAPESAVELKDLEAGDTEEVKGGGKGISKIVIDN